MAFSSAEVSVLVTATLLATADADGTTVTVKPAAAGQTETYLGGSDVTAAAGTPLGGGMSLDLAPGEKLYGISTVTIPVRVLRRV